MQANSQDYIDPGSRFLSLLRQQVNDWRQRPTGIAFDNGFCESELHASDLENELDQKVVVRPESPPVQLEQVVQVAQGFVDRLRTCGSETYWWNRVQNLIDQANPTAPPPRRGPRLG